jgi:hypothetical protein
LCAFEPIIRSNTRYWEILDPMYVEKYELKDTNYQITL